MNEKFKFLEHMADIKFKIYGSSLNEIFENAAAALSSYLTEEKVKASREEIIEVSGDDKESLLYSFMDELLFLLDAKNFIAAKAKVTIQGNNLKAELFGDDASCYEINHVKAATYSEMYIKQSDSGWEAQLVLDV